MDYTKERDIIASSNNNLFEYMVSRQHREEINTMDNFSNNALLVLKRRYLKKDADGNPIEEPRDMFMRVAKNIAAADAFYDNNADIEATENEFFDLMMNMEFLPNSPTLMNAGRELQQLSACFVIPVDDSMESIFEAIKDTAIIHKSGGGTGFDFSRLRPANSRVASTNGVSSGPISFMKVFDAATEAIKQGGTRRGANMGILRVDHVDIIEFLNCKRDDNKINNFNISVALTENFLHAVQHDEDYELINPHTKQVTKRVSAKEVFNMIVMSAWKNGEPGIIFIDRINKDNPTPHIGRIESTNPCGEQPLLPYESCNLGSINLTKVVKDGKIDYLKLGKTVHSAVHFLDNVIDMNKYPLKKIEEMTKGNRKIGLGVMGFADMLILMGIPYNSKRAIKTAEDIMSFIIEESRKASAYLAESRGVFPNFKGSIYDKKGYSPLRNATTSTIAPTGTISIIANCSSGIEPLFAVSYIRNVMDNDELVEVHPLFEAIAKEMGFYSDKLMKQIAKQGDLTNISDVPEDIKKLFVTSHHISPEWHILMQATFQKYTDNAVSKTVNFSNDAKPRDVRKAFLLAHQLGCKGITIYRDRSREEQVLNIQQQSISKKTKRHESNITPRPRPKTTWGSTYRFTTGCGNLYVTINECDKGRPFELFTHMGKAGGCSASQAEAIGRLVSLAFRSDIEPEAVVKQLVGISCHAPSWANGEKILSCSDAIGKAIKLYLKNKDKNSADPSNNGNNGHKSGSIITKTLDRDPDDDSMIINNLLCPDCSGALEKREGCLLCRECGYSKCD